MGLKNSDFSLSLPDVRESDRNFDHGRRGRRGRGATGSRRVLFLLLLVCECVGFNLLFIFLKLFIRTLL